MTTRASVTPTKRQASKRTEVRMIPLTGIPEVQSGDDLARHISSGMERMRLQFKDGDILVVAQKIVSKSEGRTILLSDVQPSERAVALASMLGKDPRFVEVVLRESRRIVRQNDRALIVETHHGFVCANAGVDQSNVPGEDAVTVLPTDCDRSAVALSASLRKETARRVAVIISDTFGRPWRLGLTDVAVGVAGVPLFIDWRGKRDRCGKVLQATSIAVVDGLTAAAGLLMGKPDGVPVVLIRGFEFPNASDRATQIVRPAEEDLFR